MADRMLVRVGYHQKDGLKIVNEKTLVSWACHLAVNADPQRRDPTERLDPFEEYVAVYRKDHIELYQDYVSEASKKVLMARKLLSKNASPATSNYAGPFRFHHRVPHCQSSTPLI
jgi:hypothetical protein